MSDYITISKLREIDKHLKKPSDTLILFDVDYVLTHPNEPAFQFPNFAYHMQFIKETFVGLTPLQRDLFANLMVFDSSGSSLVEKESPQFINELLSKGCKTLALTASLTSDIESICLKQERFENLKKLGISFETSFENLDEITFDTLESNRKTYPHFYRGILFSNGENQVNQKGAVLKEFLKESSFQPKQIIMVDDRLPNLEAIKSTFSDESIEVVGFLYKGSFIYPAKQVDKEIFESKWLEIARKATDLSSESNEVST